MELQNPTSYQKVLSIKKLNKTHAPKIVFKPRNFKMVYYIIAE